MNPDRQREEALFEEALKKSFDAERAAFLDAACAGDPHLQARVEALLEGHFQAQGFLDRSTSNAPARDAAPELGSTASSPNPGPLPLGEGARRAGEGTPGEEELGKVIGNYKLLEKVGEGGFGAVYVAEQNEPVKRRVALKIIKLGMDTRQVVARFEAERQALALMDHPNIAKVLDAGATGTTGSHLNIRQFAERF